MKVLLLIVSIIAVFSGDCHDFADGRDSSGESQQFPVNPDNHDDTTEDHHSTKGRSLTTDNTEDLKSDDDDQLLMKGRTHSERQLRRSKCKARNACVVMGGFCVTNATLCSGRLVPEGCKGPNCQCCVPGLLEQEINDFGIELQFMKDNLVNSSSQHKMDLQSMLANVNDSNVELIEQIQSSTENETKAISSLESQLNNLTQINSELKLQLDSVKSDISNQGCPKGLFWFAPSDQCFKYLTSRVNWATANSACQAQGLELAKPYDPVSLRSYLVSRYSYTDWLWLGAKGTGSYVYWQRDGQKIYNDCHLWYSSGGTKSSSYCLAMRMYPSYLKTQFNNPYTTEICTNINTYLCEYVRK